MGKVWPNFYRHMASPGHNALLVQWYWPFGVGMFCSQYLCTLKWRHNGRDSVSNHLPHDYLLNRLFRRRSKKTSKLRVTGFLCGEFTGDRWIPRINGQWCGKCFHLITSSWNSEDHARTVPNKKIWYDIHDTFFTGWRGTDGRIWAEGKRIQAEHQ